MPLCMDRGSGSPRNCETWRLAIGPSCHHGPRTAPGSRRTSDSVRRRLSLLYPTQHACHDVDDVTVGRFQIGLSRLRRISDTSSMTRMSKVPLESLNEMTPAVRAFVEVLCAPILEHDQIIATQQKRIEELERRLGINSGNSSLPPWSDRQGQQPLSTAKPKSNRKRGGQAEYLKRIRPLIPTEACDQGVHHRPVWGSACSAPLSGDDPNPKRHQVTELPPR
jgi:hypothetical protein